MFPDRYPLAIWEPGPEWKQGYSFFTGHVSQNLSLGAVIHSAEGTKAGARAVLHGPRQASWTLFFPKVGKPLQHYSLNAITWHCGRYGDAGGQVAGNGCLVGCEVEGKAGEPLTQNQLAHLISFLQWFWKVGELNEPSLPAKGQTFPTRSIPLIMDDELWEHGWISATDCPSKRIPWGKLIQALTKDTESSEWEQFTRHLVQELLYFERVLTLAEQIERRKVLLIAVWRRSSDEPPIDHEVFQAVGALCQQLMAATTDLYYRCQGQDRG